jgi:hypothetical protein
MGIYSENPEAANWLSETEQATAAAQQHAAVSANRLRYFLFGEDEDYLVTSEDATPEDQLDLMEVVARHYEVQPEADQGKPIEVAVPISNLRDVWKPEVNQPQFTISMSPFFIEGFRVVKRRHSEEPFVGSFIFKDKIEYNPGMNRIILERSAVTRFLKSHVGTDIRIPSSSELSSIRDFIHTGYVLGTGLIN